MRRLYVLGSDKIVGQKTVVEVWRKQYLWEIHWGKPGVSIHTLFSAARPDVIVTIGDKSRRHPELRKLPLYMRKRWIHVDTIDEMTPDSVEACYQKTLECDVRPLVTVFTTTFCSGEKILRPFESLRSQTFPEWEWVVMDDSPKRDQDETWDRLRSLASQDCRLRIYRQGSPRGDIGAVKRDVAMMGYGKYLVELDHDDELLPDALEVIQRVMENAPDDVAFASSDFSEIYEGGLDSHCYGSHFGMNFGSYYRQRYKGSWINVSRTPPINAYTIRHIVGVPNHVRIWRASAYRELGGHHPGMNVADDYELIIRTFLRYRMIRIPRFLYIQYRNKNKNNFTVHRNGLIQLLVRHTARRWNERIHQRILELGYGDPANFFHVCPKPPDLPYLRWEPDRDMTSIDHLEEGIDPLATSVIVAITSLTTTPAGIEECIRRAMAQSFRNWVLYLIGDHHPLLEATMNRLAVDDPRIRYWNLHKTFEDGGVTATNYALKMLVSTPFVAYMEETTPWESPVHLETLHTMIGDRGFVSHRPQEGEEGVPARVVKGLMLHRTELLEQHGYWKSATRLFSESHPSSESPTDELVSRWGGERPPATPQQPV